jgi:uncharacterized protein
MPAQALAALVAGAAGALVFSFAHMPVPWLLGSIAGAALAAMLGARVRTPRWLRDPVLAVLGLMIGSTLHGDAGLYARWPFTLAAVAAYVALVTATLYWFLRRFAGFDPVTAYFSAAPGGFMAMTVIGGALGGRERNIVLAHSVRLVLVVFTLVTAYHVALGAGPARWVPLGTLGAREAALLVLLGGGGWWLARLARLPAAAMLGPMLAMAAASLAGVARAPLPTAPLLFAELVLGSGIGAQFSGIGPRELLRGGLIALLCTVYMLALSLLFAWTLAPLTGVAFPALLLALSPGGMSGVSLVALALGVEPAFVTVHNVFRVFLILLAGPLVFRWARRLPERLD